MSLLLDEFRSAIKNASDYAMTNEQAEALKGIALLPHADRVRALRLYAKHFGQRGLVDLFAHFIGMANSVVANNREMVELFLASEGIVHPEKVHHVNLPTIFGALVGVGLANSVEQAKTCGTCAYRLASPPNQSPSTTLDAAYQVEERADFMCHERLDEREEPTTLCAGHAQRAARVSA